MSSCLIKFIIVWSDFSLVVILCSMSPREFLTKSNWYMTLSRVYLTSGLSILNVGPIALLPNTLCSCTSGAAWDLPGDADPLMLNLVCFILLAGGFLSPGGPLFFSLGSDSRSYLSVTKISVPTLAYWVPCKCSIFLSFMFVVHMTMFWSLPPDRR